MDREERQRHLSALAWRTHRRLRQSHALVEATRQFLAETQAGLRRARALRTAWRTRPRAPRPD